MKGPVQRYVKSDLTVTFDPRVCTHSAVCVRGLYDVFDVAKSPWVNLDGASEERIVEQVTRCPSGALQFSLASARKP
jgi:uncharacterized Fe-S cluster protein YjdI